MQFSKEFDPIFRRISLDFKENLKYFSGKFHQIFKKTTPIFKEVSDNFQKNLIKFLREFYNFLENFA